MFGFSFDKLLLIAAVAVLVIGPTQLPTYAAKLAALVRGVRAFTDSAKDRLREEMGPEFETVDWQKLDPRQYDPRRIIREALTDDGTLHSTSNFPETEITSYPVGRATLEDGSAPPPLPLPPPPLNEKPIVN